MSTTYHNGETHVFTSRGSSTVITLKAENGKTLSIDGVTSGGGSSSLTTEKTSTELGYIELNTPETLVSNVSTLAAQGTACELAETGSDTYLISSGPKLLTDGGAQIWLKTGGIWAQQQALTLSVASSSVDKGLYCDLNEDATLAFVGSMESGGSSVLRYQIQSRSGTTWTQDSGVGSGQSANIGRFSGNYCLIGGAFGLARILFKSGTWAVQATLSNGDDSLDGFKLDLSGGVSGTTTAIFNKVKPSRISVHTRSGTTWTDIQSLYPYAEDTQSTWPVDCRITDDTIVASSAQRVYIYERSDTLFELAAVLNHAGITKVCIPTESVGNSRIALYTTTSLILYAKDPDSGCWQLVSTNAITGGTSIGMSANHLAIGRSAAGSGVGATDVYTLDTLAPETDVTIADISLTDKIVLTSTFPVEIVSTNGTGPLQSALEITGDLSVSGAIHGHSKGNFASLSGTSDQTIGNATPTILTTVFTSLQGSNNLDVVKTTGRLVVKEAGFYAYSGKATFASSAVGYRDVQIVKSGVDVGCQVIAQPSDDTVTTMNLSGFCYAIIDDYFQVQVTQTSGGGLDITDAMLSVIQIGV